MFQINYKGEIDNEIPILKKMYRVSTKSKAIHEAVFDLVYIKIPELERLREIEKQYNEIAGIYSQKINLENQLKIKFQNNG
jgi:hypothetical protein